jgi:hypothetical protein
MQKSSSSDLQEYSEGAPTERRINMLMKPSILRIPVSTFPICETKACGSSFSSGGTRCASNFSCRPFSGGTCVNANHSGCGGSLAGAAVSGVGVIAGVGIKIT